jgi:hypothetical protein
VTSVRPAVPVAASTALTGLLTGPRQAARVAGAGERAGYLVTTGGDVVALTTPSATVPSCSLVLSGGRRPTDLLHPSHEVVLGGGEVRTPGHRLVVRRWWSPERVTPGARSRSAAAILCALLRGEQPRVEQPDVVRARAAGVEAGLALVEGSPAVAAAALLGALGLGPGLTPSGDDVAAGVLLAGRALGLPGTAAVAAEVAAAARSRTNAVSAGLLAEAAAGRSASVVIRAVDAVVGRADAGPALRALLSLGHYSGGDIASGLLAVTSAMAPAVTAHGVVAAR